jgi:hypothetical protein
MPQCALALFSVATALRAGQEASEVAAAMPALENQQFAAPLPMLDEACPSCEPNGYQNFNPRTLQVRLKF